MPALVCNGAMLRCTQGTTPSSLVVTSTHRVIMANGQIAGTIMDHVGMVNIQPFGLCRSPANPAVAAAQGAPQPCIPVVPGPWTPGSMRVTLGNMKALNDSCKAMCTWAGTISVQYAGQPNVKVD